MEKVLISNKVNGPLWKRFKITAVRRQLSLQDALEKALRLYLGESGKHERQPRFIRRAA